MYIDAHAHYTLMHKDAYPFRDQKYLFLLTLRSEIHIYIKRKTSQSMKQFTRLNLSNNSKKNVSIYQT